MPPDRLIRSLARSQFGLVARRQLVVGGVSEAVTRRRVSVGMLEEVTPRVLRLCGVPGSDAQRLMAAVLHTGSAAILSHSTSACWWGIAGFRLDPIHVAIERNQHWEEDSPAVVHHATIIPKEQRKVLNGIPVCSPALTIFQLAGTISPNRVARALDNAWSLRLLDGLIMSRLLEELAKPGRNGIRLIRELLKDRGADWVPPASNVEHRFDEIMRRAGIATFRRQVSLGDEEFTGRVDFLDSELPLVVEVQSERFHTALTDKTKDAVRRAAMEAQGLLVIEVWDFEIFHTPWVVVQRVKEARSRLLAAA
jgi:very-short-patch-repair endonuclease